MYCCLLLRDGLAEDILGGLADNVDRGHEQVDIVPLLVGNLVVVQLRRKGHFVDRIDTD